MQSGSIAALAAALSKAQGEIQGAVKDSTNPFFKSNYADLSSVWEACRQALTKNGLCVIQVTSVTEKGAVLITTLAHSSGEYISGEYPITPSKPDAQALGSAVTYARRYALAAIVGVCPIDDDGESAMHRDTKAAQPPHKTVTEAQIKRLYAIANTANWSPQMVKTYLKNAFNLDSIKDLNWIQYDELCNEIEKHPVKGGSLGPKAETTEPKPAGTGANPNFANPQRARIKDDASSGGATQYGDGAENP